MPKNVNIQLIAHTDAAGKCKPSAPMGGNEDDFFVSVPLTQRLASDPEGLPIPRYGLIMAVADGMGGLRHGDQASKIAVRTVGELLSHARLEGVNIESSVRRRMLLEETIKKADENLKAECGKRQLVGKMGSTLIIAWLYNKELVVSWIGDSRAYVYNHRDGISPVSHDHSLVQMLVDRGEISYDEAFDHPKNNIVARCLGDPTQEAKPSSCIRKVGIDDTILLCSDGLTGVLRDSPAVDRYGKPYPQQNIEDILRQSDTISQCQQNLWTAAQRGGWHDNVTTIICRLKDYTGLTPEPEPLSAKFSASRLSSGIELPRADQIRYRMATTPPAKPKPGKSRLGSVLILILLVTLLSACVWLMLPRRSKVPDMDNTEMLSDQLTPDQSQEVDYLPDDVPLADKDPDEIQN